MIHYRPPQGSSPENGNSAGASNRHRVQIADQETLLSHVREAKRAADESLRRAQDVPEPHVTTNTIFVAIYEQHQRDREALFEAMRRLDDAREALRAIACEMNADPDGPAARRLAG